MKSLITLVKRAAEAAGISDMAKGYPTDQKQRGATYWASFVGHVNGEAAQVDEYVRELEEQIRVLSSENRKLQRENQKLSNSKTMVAAEKWADRFQQHLSSDQKGQFLADMRG